ncbi:MAG: MBL fold metallo-hydrolase, partial [Candidatus Sumerlaeia bacterium]|nr:MBL fold metallo-hydrolase [Candidatus Sumerlaeia bacterium]
QATFLDVGQGDCCVVELPGGTTVLVDAGDYSVRAGERIVVPFLESRGIDYLDAVVVTHPDADHIGGLPAVFDDLTVAWLLEGPATNPTFTYQRLTDAVRLECARQDQVFAGDRIELPSGAQISFLHPPRNTVYSERNNLSLVLKIEAGVFRILIAGDIEAQAERDLLDSGADLACDILKVAHHGAATATSQAWIDRAQPRIAVISCGAGNPFGHPAPEVLERLTSAGVTVLRTDRDGAISVRIHGRSVEWRVEGKP